MRRETKNLCYQFESIVTNSSLSFRDIYRADKGSVSLCDYYPPTDDDAGLPIIKKAPASCGY